ncbi:MAG TPA: PspC domain-containing protein [Mucilaginibacter sp.]|jgi:phage shock protein PspC (stress-responsive transcriptional regulator)|nr:PspC domain-containing protein [Mucilaginibacter sp.]
MNKTIIININGTVFHIEEDAYEILKNYMTDVKRHFLNSADSLEITTDIENRIAEMFTDILTRDNKQVIVEQDVKLVIEQMGTVQDFEHADEDNQSAANDHYTYNNGARSLFRDPDDHLIAGVCAGLANYFNINPVWVRLLFALSTAFAGTGLMLYVILWMVIPKAITRGDRMAMKGQKLDLQGFKANFEEELSAVKGHLSNLHHEARPVIYKLRDFLSDFFYHMGKFLNGAGNAFVKFLGIALLLACFAGVIALVVCLGLAEVWGKAPTHLFPFSVVDNIYANKIYISAFFVAFIPLLAIILTVIKVLFKTRSMDVNIGVLILVIWLFSIGTLVFYGSKVSAGFRSSASFNQTVSIKPTKNNIYYLKLNDVKYFTHEDSLRLDIKSHFKNMIVTDDDDNINDFEPKSVYIHIEKSDVNQPVLVESFRSQGSQYEDALFNARNTSYLFTQQDTVLKFDRALQRAAGTSWHGQQVELTLRIPLNATVVIDERLDRYLDGIDIRECKENNKQPDATSAAFTMTANGLECKIDTLVTTAAKVDSSRMTSK